MTRSEEIEKVELTPEELSIVIWQAKYTKYNKIKNKDVWNDPDEPKEIKHEKRQAKSGSA